MKFNFLNRNEKTNNIAFAKSSVDNLNYSENDNDFKLVFNDTTNTDANHQVISFGNLTKSKLYDTLTIYRHEKLITTLELRYAYSCSNKLEAIKFNRFIAIGLSGFFYLYDLSSETVILFIDFNGYFDEFKISDDYLLVAYNSGIYCLTKYGQIKWHNCNIGLDGITIGEVTKGKIYGSEQIDPPEGWQDFILDLETGERTQ